MCWEWVGKGFFFILESPCFVETTSLILAVGNLTVPLSHRIRVGKCEPRGGREEINKSFSSQFVSILSVHSRNVPVRLCNSLLKIKSLCANPTNPLEEPFCPQWFYSCLYKHLVETAATEQSNLVPGWTQKCATAQIVLLSGKSLLSLPFRILLSKLTASVQDPTHSRDTNTYFSASPGHAQGQLLHQQPYPTIRAPLSMLAGSLVPTEGACKHWQMPRSRRNTGRVEPFAVTLHIQAFPRSNQELRPLLGKQAVLVQHQCLSTSIQVLKPHHSLCFSYLYTKPGMDETCKKVW